MIKNNNQIIDYLLEIPSNLIDKKDFLNFCYKYYENNPNQLEVVEEFEHLYSPSNELDYFFDQIFINIEYRNSLSFKILSSRSQ